MSAEWLVRFHRDCTKETIAIALGYTDKLIGGYLQAEGIQDLRSANDYVHGAILDTMQGIRTWNPERPPCLPLYRHLCRVVYSRVYHDRQRYKRQRAASFHEVDLDGENSVEVAMSLARHDERKRPDGAVALRELHAKAWAAIHMLAAARKDNADLMELIACREVGIVTEPEVRARTGWPEQRYQNACRRYETVLRKLPEDLLRALVEAISRAPTHTGDDLRKAKGTEIGARDAKAVNDDDEPELYDCEDSAGDDVEPLSEAHDEDEP